MRNLFLGAAAMMAIAAPGVATAQIGYVGADYSSTDVDGLGSEDGFGASGAVELTGHFAVDAGVFELGARGFFEPPPFLLFFSRRIGLDAEINKDGRRLVVDPQRVKVPVVGHLRPND